MSGVSLYVHPECACVTRPSVCGHTFVHTYVHPECPCVTRPSVWYSCGHTYVHTYVHPECACVIRPSVWYSNTGTECVGCSRDKNCPKAYSCDNNMYLGPVPQELLVTITGNYYILAYAQLQHLMQGLTQVEEMLSQQSCHSCHSSWAVWLHWTRCQPATGCGLLCQSLPRLPSETIIIFIFNKTGTGYRGISLLSIPYKVFASIPNQSLVEWLEDIDILVEEQCDFRVGRGTIEQVLNIATIAETRQKLGLCTFVAFIDFKRHMILYNIISCGTSWNRICCHLTC